MLEGEREKKPFDYPRAPKEGGVTEIRDGLTISDPYRALEDLDSDLTHAYINKQNQFANTFLNALPGKELLKDRLRSLYSRPHNGPPMQQSDGSYYWLSNPGSLPMDVMMRSKDLEKDYGNHSSSTLFFDPNHEDHTSLYASSWSESGRYWGAVLQDSGSDWQQIRTVDVNLGQTVGEDLRWSKFTFGPSFIGDMGFLYKCSIDKMSMSSGTDGEFGLYYHQINTSQSQDVLIMRGSIFGRPIFTMTPTSSHFKNAWLFIDLFRDAGHLNQAFMVDITDAVKAGSHGFGERLKHTIDAQKQWIAKDFSGFVQFVGYSKTGPGEFLFRTSRDGADSYKVISSKPVVNPSREVTMAYKDVIPESKEKLLLRFATLFSKTILVLEYLKDAQASLIFMDLSTRKEIPMKLGSFLPPFSTISSMEGKWDANDFYLSVESFTVSPYVLQCLVKENTNDGGRQIVLRRLGGEVKEDLEETLICTQIFFKSSGGATVPLFLCHLADLDFSRPQPSLLHAYGGFGTPSVPHFDPFFVAFMRQVKGVVAVAGIRGGGEYGDSWHQAATGVRRHVSFEDFENAAHYLHSEGLSCPSMTCTYGTSNGGLLVCASMIREPDLYRVVMPDVPLTDMVRYHLFTLGRLWLSEYGDPGNGDDLRFLFRYSPYHNVDRHNDYPATLLTTADHDDRVVPSHSLKFVAQLQTTKAKNKYPFLCRIYQNAGHESGSRSVEQKVQVAADRLGFVASSLGLHL